MTRTGTSKVGVVPQPRTASANDHEDSGERPTRAVTNDMELITSVLALAQDPGYVLVGPAERVWRCRIHGCDELEQAPGYEDAAVHQLIDQRLLRVGGTKQMRYGHHTGRAQLVTVPKTTAAMAWRWRSYQPAR